jgi:hypothetical protein
MSTTTLDSPCRREAVEALMGVVQADLATHPMSESAVDQCAAPRRYLYLNIAFVGQHCLLEIFITLHGNYLI